MKAREILYLVLFVLQAIFIMLGLFKGVLSDYILITFAIFELLKAPIIGSYIDEIKLLKNNR